MVMVPPAKDSHHFAFSFGDALHVCAVSKVDSRDKQGAPLSGSLVGLRSRVNPQTRLYADATVRRLQIEMHCVFERCRSLARTMEKGKLDNDSTLRISREYRSVLRAAADEHDDSCMHMRDFTLWSLFETMFLKGGDTPICLDLIAWAADTFSFVRSIEETASEEIQEGVPPDEGNYWKAVALQLVGLRFDVCIDLLRYVERDSDAVGLLIEQLEKLDVSWLADQLKIPRFEAWQSEMRRLIEGGRFADHRTIAFLARTLTGDRNILSRLAEVTLSEWWHLMPFFVLFCAPTAPYNGLGPVAEECRSLFKNLPVEEEFDPFLALFNMKDVAMLQHLLTNPWLSFHLVDVMFSSAAYDQPIHELRSGLLLNYGSSLITNSSLWELGAAYLLECGVEGKLRLETHITTLAIEDEQMAEKLLRLCLDNDLEESRTCVINTMTYRHLRECHWASGLSWALRGGRSKTLDTAVHRIICHASEDQIASLCVLEHLNELLLLSPSLSFLDGYYRFQKTQMKGDFKAAAQILVPLLMSPDVPPAFHQKLFGHLTIILQEVSQVLFPKETIFQLLSFFKQYTNDLGDDDKVSFEKDMLLLKRLLLTRLADAIVANP